MVIPIIVVECMCRVLLELRIVVLPELECLQIVADRMLSIDYPVFEVQELLSNWFRLCICIHRQSDGELEDGYTINVMRSAGERIWYLSQLISDIFRRCFFWIVY